MTAAIMVKLGERGGTPYVALSEVAPLVRRQIRIDPEETYIELGVRSFHKGTFHRRTVKGADFDWQDLYRVQADDLVFSNIMAWEGAIALAGAEDEGCVGNHRMLTCEVDRRRVHPAFLAHYFKTPEGMRKLVGASTGTVARNRTLTATALSRITVPIPSLGLQQNVVSLLEVLASKTREVDEHLDAVARDSAALLLSLHHQLSEGRRVRLGDMLDLLEESEPVVSTGRYPQVGVRGFGGGLFPKSAIEGVETSYKSFNRLYTGAIVLSQVKGWEGAIARCPSELAGWYVSPEYRTFACKPSLASDEYLGALVATEWFWEQLQASTRGVGARRERTKPEQFLGLVIPMPDLADQLKAVSILKRQEHLKAKHAAIREANAALLPATLERVFQSEAAA
jgi:type I restriction enzyme S subunit